MEDLKEKLRRLAGQCRLNLSRMSFRKNLQIDILTIWQQAGYSVRRGPSQNYGTVPDLFGLPDIHIECKRVERLDLLGAIQQAQRDSERFRDGLPAVFHRRNRSPWIVSMPLDCWMQLYKKAERNEEK